MIATEPPLPPRASLEDALIVASLAHATARTPQQRRDAWARLMQLKAQREQQKG